MFKYIITLHGNEYSEAMTQRCLESAKNNGVEDVHIFNAIDKDRAPELMTQLAMPWTWPQTNEKICPESRLKMKPYTTDDIRKVWGCAMSHYFLWVTAMQLEQPIVILEHDAVFIRPLPIDIECNTICMLNDPKGATPKGKWWSDQMIGREEGIYPKTKVFSDDRPDGLAGNSAYYITPSAAEQAVEKVDEVGLWPNDALLCRQFFDLYEYSPPIVKTNQTQSTTSGFKL